MPTNEKDKIEIVRVELVSVKIGVIREQNHAYEKKV